MPAVVLHSGLQCIIITIYEVTTNPNSQSKMLPFVLLTSVVLFAFIVYGYLRPKSVIVMWILYNLYASTPLGYLYHLRQLSKSRKKGKLHSKVRPKIYKEMKILPISIVFDNYSYLVVDTATKQAIVIDPSDPDVVKEVVKQEDVFLEAILTTHKHWDHSGGNYSLKRDFPHLAVYGSAEDDVPCLTNSVKCGDIVKVGSLSFHVLATPGHTRGHVVYVLQGARFHAPDSLFSGDLLFLGGCGRIFEGDSITMYESLGVVSSLKEDTLLWPGHEYALQNLLFAVTIEPENIHLQAKIAWVLNMSKKGLSSCPSTIREERQYNPFLRTHIEGVIAAVGMDNATMRNQSVRGPAVLGALRERKNQFKG